jgi:methylated-DNA-[protein]-cysteine S-methyltransferase
MDDATPLYIDHLDTPVGRLAIVVDGDDRLRCVGFTDRHARMERLVAARRGALVAKRNPGGLTSPLGAYFEGDLAAIDGLPVAMEGTDFQRRVWAALREIPCGETWSYRDLAAHIGQPKAVRAVGLANGANPVGVVVPCHRVIGADGSLTGYGGGVDRKRWLLEHERAARVDSQLRFA